MLKDHLNSLLEKDREQHPISEQDFEHWSSQHVTKRMFIDIEMALYDSIDKVGGKTIEEAAASALLHQALRRMKDIVIDWKPEELE